MGLLEGFATLFARPAPQPVTTRPAPQPVTTRPAPQPAALPRSPWPPEAVVSGNRTLSWGYQLQNVDAGAVAASRFDYMVVDWTSDGKTPWTPAAVARMRAGGARKVLAYVSIGEAESYRPYWAGWKPGKPAFVGERNPDWPDNYPVDFTDGTWQSIVQGMLNQTVTSGFDGIYLDKVDVYEDKDMGDRGARLMRAWVIGISRALKAVRAGYLIFPQNAPGLMEFADYRAAIDGTGREDMLFGQDGTDGRRNSTNDIADNVGQLVDLAREGKPILAVEYSDNPGKRADMLVELQSERRLLPTLIPLVTRRALDRLPS